MSNKHKKARKNPKEFKPRPPKSSRDPLTGLHADVGGEKIYSDRIYNQDTSPLHKRLLEHASIEVEYELGKNAIIITTGMYDYDGGGTLNTRKISYQRIAALGSFEYDDKGKFVEGEIREVGSWTFTKTTEGEFIGEYGEVDIGRAPFKSSLDSAFPNLLSNRQFDYLMDGEFQAGDSRNDFFQYESAQYFAGNWWDNPFAPNLI